MLHTRLAPGDSLASDLLSQWARQSGQDGNFALAARCFLIVGGLAGAAVTFTVGVGIVSREWSNSSS